MAYITYTSYFCYLYGQWVLVSINSALLAWFIGNANFSISKSPMENSTSLDGISIYY